MTITIGETAPDVPADTSTGRLHRHDGSGSDWAVFSSPPGEFTRPCLPQIAHAFAKRYVTPLGLSADGADEPLNRIADANDTQHMTFSFPIMADPDRSLARRHGVIHPPENETAAPRSVLIIDRRKKIRLTMTSPRTMGRTFAEIPRLIDALQAADAKRIATPANGRPGGVVTSPTAFKSPEAQALFPPGWTETRPSLRRTTL